MAETKQRQERSQKVNDPGLFDGLMNVIQAFMSQDAQNRQSWSSEMGDYMQGTRYEDMARNAPYPGDISGYTGPVGRMPTMSVSGQSAGDILPIVKRVLDQLMAESPGMMRSIRDVSILPREAFLKPNGTPAIGRYDPRSGGIELNGPRLDLDKWLIENVMRHEGRHASDNALYDNVLSPSSPSGLHASDVLLGRPEHSDLFSDVFPPELLAQLGNLPSEFGTATYGGKLLSNTDVPNVERFATMGEQYPNQMSRAPLFSDIFRIMDDFLHKYRGQ